MSTSIATRIRQARRRRNLSLRALAEASGLSHTAVNNYEKGKRTPDSKALRSLARGLNVRTGALLRPVRVGEIEADFRKKASLGKRKQGQVIEEVRDWLERALDLIEIVEGEAPPFALPDDFPVAVARPEEAEAVAERLREAWDLGRVDPIENLTYVLEEHGVLVGQVEAPDAFDACTFHAPLQRDGEAEAVVPVMATRHGLPGDRQRFNLAHELGHLVMDLSGIDADRDQENACHRFAAALLAPAPAVREALGEHRGQLSIRELGALKAFFGLSMQALVRRAVDLGIVSQHYYRGLSIHFRKQGWHRTEPGPAYPPETPLRIELLAGRAVAEGLITRRRATELLGEPVEEHMDAVA